MATFMIDEHRFVIPKDFVPSRFEEKQLEFIEKDYLELEKLNPTCSKPCQKCCCTETCDIIEWVKKEKETQPTDLIFHLSCFDQKELQASIERLNWKERLFQLEDGCCRQTLTHLLTLDLKVPLPLNFVTVGCAKCARIEHMRFDQNEPSYRQHWWTIISQYCARKLRVLHRKDEFPHKEGYETFAKTKTVEIVCSDLNMIEKKACSEVFFPFHEKQSASFLT